MGEHTKTLEERAYKVLGPPTEPVCKEKIPIDELKELRRMGYSVAKCAKFYGVSRPTIYKILGGGRAMALADLGHYDTMAKTRKRLKKRAIRDYREAIHSGTTDP